MRTILSVSNLNTNEDVIKIKDAVSHNEGIIACEINLGKKEVNIIYDDKTVNLEKIIESIEEYGYSVI